MENKLIEKMIKNCLKQYYEADSMLLGEEELEGMTKQILRVKEEEPKADMYEVINDIVYEFLTH